MGAREYMFILLKARHYMLLRRGVSVGGVTSDYCGKNQKKITTTACRKGILWERISGQKRATFFSAHATSQTVDVVIPIFSMHRASVSHVVAQWYEAFETLRPPGTLYLRRTIGFVSHCTTCHGL